MNILCWLFGHKWRFVHKAAEDGVVREGYQNVYVMCPRCGAICDIFQGYIGSDGEIYEDPNHMLKEKRREG